VEVVDSTDLDFDQTVDAVIGVIRTNVPAQTGARDGR
jgi:cytidylate kinase